MSPRVVVVWINLVTRVLFEFFKRTISPPYQEICWQKKKLKWSQKVQVIKLRVYILRYWQEIILIEKSCLPLKIWSENKFKLHPQNKIQLRVPVTLYYNTIFLPITPVSTSLWIIWKSFSNITFTWIDKMQFFHGGHISVDAHICYNVFVFVTL